MIGKLDWITRDILGKVTINMQQTGQIKFGILYSARTNSLWIPWNQSTSELEVWSARVGRMNKSIVLD